ncbi:hypothetical protein [Candidatus Ichthyocystis sparus]|uniref:hypothetical protein n=1 Tax=Candidatus Ichthyocystis sparus TaxID=1561004 RepID=UPI00159EEA57|nr:hypothetical protein [Candidatus Ichthyocystis sparus]
MKDHLVLKELTLRTHEDCLIVAIGVNAEYLGLSSVAVFLGKEVSACATCY